MWLLLYIPLLFSPVSAIFPFGPNESLPAGFCCPLKTKAPKPAVAKVAQSELSIARQGHKREIQELQGNATHSYGRYELNLLWIYLSDILKNPNATSLHDVKLGVENGTSIVHKIAYDESLPANSTLSSLMTNDSTELDPLSYLRSIAVFLFSLLQQGDTCSTEVKFFTPRCPLWQPPTPARVSRAEAKLEVAGNLTASIVGHALYVVFHKLNATLDARWQSAGLKIPIRLEEQTRFACAGWYCLTSSVSAFEQKWAMDTVKQYLDKLMNSMFYIGGGVYPGVLKRYYPNCMLLNTGCTTEKDSVKFMECLESKRAWTIDWGAGPQQGQKMVENLPSCT